MRADGRQHGHWLETDLREMQQDVPRPTGNRVVGQPWASCVPEFSGDTGDRDRATG
jgi:hypothetical protein